MSLVECKSSKTDPKLDLWRFRPLLLIEQVLVIIGAWKRNREAANHLASLDDHLLKDIGITRSQINAGVNGKLHHPHLY